MMQKLFPTQGHRVGPFPWIVTIEVLLLSLGVNHLNAQLLDESCTVTIGGQTVQVNSDGSFSIANITAADSNADFISDNPVRLIGVCLRDGETTYVASGCFQFTGGQTFSLSDADLTVSSEPPLDIGSITASFDVPTLTSNGQTTHVDVLAMLADGSTAVPDPVTDCMSFRSSNPAIATVDETGLVTAKGSGTALITVQAQAATSVAAITVSLGDPLTTVAGIVEDASGNPVQNATVFLEGTAGSDVTDANGAFSIAGVATLNGNITAKTTPLINGVVQVGASDPTPPLAGMITDVGVIVVSNRIPWVSAVSGSWHTAGNWFGGFIPGTGQIAVIDVPTADVTVTYSTGTTNLAALECSETLALSNGTLSIDEASFVEKLSLTGGTLTGAGDLLITSSLTWSSTTISGAGTMTIEPGVVWSAPGPFNPNLFRPLINHGNGTVSGASGSLNLNNSTFTNAADGTLTISNLGITNAGATNSVVNQGTLNLTGTATKTIGVPLTNSGTIDLQQGLLNLSSTGTSSGFLSLATGTTLTINGTTYTFDSSSEVSGDGTLVVNSFGASVTMQGDYVIPSTSLINGILTFNTGQEVVFPSLTLTGGTLNGSDNFSLTGSFTWSSTVMSGTGTTTIEPGVVWSAPGPFNPNLSRSLTNHGSGTVSGASGSLTLTNGTFVNAADGTLTISNGGITGSGTSSLVNQGTVNLTGTTTKTISVPFTNSGTIDLQQGTLSLANTGGTSGGLLVVASGATLSSIATSVTFDAASTLDSSGTVSVSGGTTTIQGSYASPFTTVSGFGVLTFNTGEVVTLPTVTLSGILNGNDDLSVTSLMNWTAGSMSGTGTTTIEADATLNTPSTGIASLARPLINEGLVISSFGFSLNNTSLTNAAGGILTMSNTAGLFSNGGANSFVNSGLMDLTGTGSGTFTVPTTNDGTIQIGTGRTMFVSNPGVTLINQPTGVIKGTGTLNVANGALFTQSGNMNPGSSAGILTVTGTLPETSTAAINIELGGLVEGAEYDKLTISGTATLDGTLNVSLINDFQPQLGQTFTIMTYGSFTGAFDTINGTDLGNGLQLDVQPGAQSIVLEVVTSGG